MKKMHILVVTHLLVALGFLDTLFLVSERVTIEFLFCQVLMNISIWQSILQIVKIMFKIVT